MRNHYSKATIIEIALVLTNRVSSQVREVIAQDRVKVSGEAYKQMVY